MVKELLKIVMYRVKRDYRQFLSITLLPHIYKNIVKLKKFNKSNNGNIAIIVLCEHIGDIVTCEPVSTYLKKEKGKNVVWIVRSSYKELLSLFNDVDMVLDVDCISECAIMMRFLNKYEVHNLHMDPRECGKYAIPLHNKNRTYVFNNYFKHGSILETFSVVGNLPCLKKKPHLTLSNEDRFPDLNTPFVAIQLDSNEDIKNWDLRKWEGLLSSYPNVTFVEVGLISHMSHLPNCNSSYCGKLSLVDIAYLIKKCTAFIGIDSSVAHYANAFDKPSIIMMGVYRHYRKYVPYTLWEDNFYMVQSEVEVKDIPLRHIIDIFDERIVPLLHS